MFELTYKYEHPVLVIGYIIKTANDDPESDPKDWKINCFDINKKEDIDISTIDGEVARDRSTEKDYRIDSGVWTNKISI